MASHELDAPPPTTHVLKPHHIDLLAIVFLTFREIEPSNLPSDYLLHIYRVLLQEVSEVAQPRSHHELILELERGPKAEGTEAQAFINAFKTVHVNLDSTDRITAFFNNLPGLFMERHDEEPPIFMRRSLFGYFCRRCFFSFIKLSFPGIVKLHSDYEDWCRGNTITGCEKHHKEKLSSDFQLFRTVADKKSWAKPDAYEEWERGLAVGDEKVATENLRRFFEQHFHDNNDSGVRQHALLNLVRMHYIREEYAAARKLLSEAIHTARTSGDRMTLLHCVSLLHRLPPTPGRKSVINEIQPDLHPFEVLHDVVKLLDEDNSQPLGAAFEKIVQATGLYDHWLDSQRAIPSEADQWALHAVQSIVWETAGCTRLASIEEDIVIAFSERGSGDNTLLMVHLNKAYKCARQGGYTEALSALVSPEVWIGLSLDDYASWAQQVWHIMVLRATRRGQDRLYREFLLQRRPPGPFNPKEYQLQSDTSVPLSKIREPLHRFLQMRHRDQATTAIDQLLTALWQAEFLFRLPLYRTGIVLLADIGLEFGMSKKCRRILDEIMPQVINGNDLEQRANACFTLARCIMSVREHIENELREAIPYLEIAEADFSKLEMYRSLMDVQYFLSVIHHNLGMDTERDAAASRHLETERRLKELGTVAYDDELHQVFSIIAEIGAALADR